MNPLLSLHQQLHSEKTILCLEDKYFQVQINNENQRYVSYEDMILIVQHPGTNSIYGILAREYPVTLIIKCGKSWATIVDTSIKVNFILNKDQG